jgi:hypothetical protein
MMSTDNNTDNPKVNEELLRILIDKVDKLEASTAARHDDRDRHFQSALDEMIDIQKHELAFKLEEMKRKDEHKQKLQRMLHAAQQETPSPESPIAVKRPPVLNLDISEYAPAPAEDLW